MTEAKNIISFFPGQENTCGGLVSLLSTPGWTYDKLLLITLTTMLLPLWELYYLDGELVNMG